MNNFRKSYLEYLGADQELIEQGQSVFPSIHRVEPESSLSYMYHHLIVSRYQGRLIHSVAPSIFPDYRETAPEDSENLQMAVDDAFASVYRGKFYRIREMFRYTTERLFPEDPSVTALTEEHRELAMSRMSSRGKRVKDKFWNTTLLPMVQDGRILAVILKGMEVARSNVTDLPCDAANIDVWTHPDHRRKGFGQAVVKQAINWCLLNGRVPEYLVHSDNTASVNLAESMGLVRMAEEIQTVVIRY